LSKPDRPDEWVCQRRRELFGYLHWLQTLRMAFAPRGPVRALMGEGADASLAAFEVLAEARRRMEIDPGSGWRKTVQAEEALRTLLAASSPEEPPGTPVDLRSLPA
jgi:hypothetical protein